MKIFNYSFNKNDGWIFVLIFPYHLLINFLLFGSDYFTDPVICTQATLFALVLWPVSWFVHTIAGFRVRRHFPEIRQTTVRVCLSLVVFLSITFVQNCLIIATISYFNIFGRTFDDLHVSAVLTAGININIMATAVFESAYLINKWKHSIIETQELKKVQIQTELDNLKNQVNPHFLFNSINSLSSLISEDPEKAQKFLSNMSKVYRYLLQNNDQELTPLSVELEFVQSYFHMLKTRYEDGISLEEQIPDSYRQYLLPPLTLQMLLENAVKHNVIIGQTPLNIKLSINIKDQLVVSNNINKKITVIESNKIGLNNIKTKYRLLNLEEVMVEETPDHFTVIVPLVKPHE